MRHLLVAAVVLVSTALGACGGGGGGTSTARDASPGQDATIPDAAPADLSVAESHHDLGSPETAAGDTTSFDAADADATSPGDAGADAGPDVDSRDDVAPEAVGDAVHPPADSSDDTDTSVGPEAGDVPAEAGCEPVTCELACPFGFLKDEGGCDLCACRDCATDGDCAYLDCPAATCSAGRCACGCGAVPPVAYECPDGTLVPFCACSPLGWKCLQHPESQCPTLCRPGVAIDLPCPDGTTLPWCECKTQGCAPVCEGAGSFAEGWYDGCTKSKLGPGPCAGCTAYCGAIGTPAEGWYDSCSGKLVSLQPCGPVLSCSNATTASCNGGTACKPGTAFTYTCPDGTEVPFCKCGIEDGGATASFKCEPEPFKQCEKPLACTKEGGTFDLDGRAGTCCPGLVLIDLAAWDGQTCLDPGCNCKACTYCGDGVCKEPENVCSCPSDCTPVTEIGSPCGPGCSGPACNCGPAKDLYCALPEPGAKVGACTRVCDPSPASPVSDCGEGFSCVPILGVAAPGICLKACGPDEPCSPPLSCGVPQVATGKVTGSTCFAWPPCDPVMDLGCGEGAQCRIGGTAPACGEPGALDLLDECDPDEDECGSMLACHPGLHLCVYVCREDASCQQLGFSSCALAPGSAFGHCTV